MAEIILITGGARSGKSSFALTLCKPLSNKKAFIATSTPFDKEMESRIQKHKKERNNKNWDTFEEPIELSSLIKKLNNYNFLLIDCLTLWINNIILKYEKNLSSKKIEEKILKECDLLLKECKKFKGTIIFISNEVGLGIVPNNKIARIFRDISGFCNQKIALKANKVIFMVSGLPMYLKNN